MPVRKTDPIRYCAACASRLIRKRINGRLEDSGVFNRRKYCDQTCMADGQKKAVVTRGAHQARARKHKKEACEQCGTSAGLHVHHRDRDFRNDDPGNLQTLCGSCHLKEHWRDGAMLPKRYFVHADALATLLGLLDDVAPRLPRRLQEKIKAATANLHANPRHNPD